MLSQDSLEWATRQAGIDAEPRYLAETASTNADALALAERGAPAWTVVAAGHQTAGRGRLGRSWTSAAGRSLLFSVILRPDLSAEGAPLLSLLAAVEMARACLPAEVAAKWPNDLLVGRRKVGGILPEAGVDGGRVGHVVLGIGVNVSMGPEDFPPGLRERATSLLIEGGPTDASGVLASFLSTFRGRCRPEQPGFARDVLEDYRRRCVTLGRRVRGTGTDGAAVEGIAAGLDRRGGLIVLGEGGEHVVGFGEVVHLD